MKTIFLLMIASGFISPLKGQWKKINTNTKYNLQEIVFTNNNNGYIAGNDFNKGIILKTRNAGTTWDTIAFNFSLSTVSFLNEATGYAAGKSIIKTTDSGNSWSARQLPEGTESIHFISDGLGFSGGSDGFSIFKTVDGAKNWTNHSIGPDNSFIQDFSFTNAATGIAVGWYIGKIAKTTDTGNTWISITKDYQLFSVDFPTSKIGYAVGWYGTIVKTTDGGDTWTQQISGVSNPDILYSIHCIDSNNCYAVGDRGIIIKTTDGGDSWQKETTATSFRLNSVFCTHSGTCYIAGDSGILLKKENALSILEPTNEKKNNLIVYPNPSNQQITIQYTIANTEPGACILLTDIQGKEIKRINLSGTQGMHTIILENKDFNPGVYLCSLYANGKTIETVKFVIEN